LCCSNLKWYVKIPPNCKCGFKCFPDRFSFISFKIKQNSFIFICLIFIIIIIFFFIFGLKLFKS